MSTPPRRRPPTGMGTAMAPHPPRGPRRSRGPVAAVIAGLALALVAGGIAIGHYGLPHHESQPAARHGTDTVNSHNVGAPVTVTVSPRRAFTITVPGAGTIHGGPGAVTTPGKITAQALTGISANTADLTVAGEGVDVTFAGTKLRQDVTVTFNNLNLPPTRPGTIDAVLHQRDDGTSEVLPAHRLGTTKLAFRTRSFSPNFPINLDLRQWFADRFDSIADAISGRTDPATCANNAPSWALLTSSTDMVHACAITNADSAGTPRAEAQFKTNRREWIYMRVPPGANYVWVKDQPDWLRTFLAGVSSENRDNYVLLAPTDGFVTAGYYQPTDHDATTKFTFGTDGTTQLLTLGSAVLEALGLDPKTAFASSMLLVATCKDDVPGLLSGDIQGNALPFLRCVSDEALGHLADSNTAFSAAMSLWGDAGYAESAAKGLAFTKGSLQVLGLALKAAALVGVVRDEVNRVVDGIVGLLAPSSTTAHLTLTGTTPAPAPSTPATTPPAPGSTVPIAPAAPAQQQTTPAAPQDPGGQPVTAYDDYGPAAAGIPMCRGNAGQARSMPGGTVSQTFTAYQSVDLTSALVQIDPDSTVTAHATLSVAGGGQSTSEAAAAGDTTFTFSPVHVPAGSAVTLTISFTATYGKIITIYQAGTPGGTMTVSNSCPDGAPTFTTTSTGLRARISGTTS